MMSPPSLAAPVAEKIQFPLRRRESPAAGELIRLENVTKTYRMGEVDVPVLKGLSLTILRGEMVALMGASGSGKTTLMNILGCLDRPSSGKYWLDGQEMSGLSPDKRALVRTAKLGFVFQSFNLLRRTSALNNVLMPLDYSLWRPSHHDARLRGKSLLAQVGLVSRLDHQPSQMSGGQQQRVAIARALVNGPALVLADEPTGNLDSHTGDEILRMFRQLNAQGITVILVTHDAKVAGYADRTIRIADGLLADDSASCDMKYGDESHPPPGPPQPETLPSVRRPLFSAESLVPPTLRTSLGNLRRNKLRSILTALGVIIGVGAVIAMTEIGEGSKAAVARSIANMGANKLPIFPSAANTGGVNQGSGTVQTLKPGDVEAIAEQCPDVKAVVPMVWARAQIIYEDRNWCPQQLTGTGPDYLVTRDWEDLQEGNCFTDDDVRSINPVCLIGATVKRELFDDESPIGKVIRIRNVPFRVIGLLSRKGANMTGQDQDDCVIAPWTTIKYRVNSQGAGSTTAAAAPVVSTVNTLDNPYLTPVSIYPQETNIELDDTPQAMRQTSIDFIQAKAATADEIPAAMDEIEGVLRDRHHLAAGRGDDFKIINMTEVLQASAQTADLMGALLLILATISLMVGGVGIMNIMLVSVTERTREIGLRMAVGARRRHILQQFLAEAVLLCLVGGGLGILAGRGASILVREYAHWPTGVSVAAIVLSVLVSGLVGVVFGFYPAWKASRLDPIEALRHE
jgi:macrolide transport system ATP-binding/permease protein